MLKSRCELGPLKLPFSTSVKGSVKGPFARWSLLKSRCEAEPLTLPLTPVLKVVLKVRLPGVVCQNVYASGTRHLHRREGGVELERIHMCIFVSAVFWYERAHVMSLN